MTNLELSKQIPLERAIKAVDVVVAEFRNANRNERQALELSMIRISETAKEAEALKIEVSELKAKLEKLTKQKK